MLTYFIKDFLTSFFHCILKASRPAAGGAAGGAAAGGGNRAGGGSSGAGAGGSGGGGGGASGGATQRPSTAGISSGLSTGSSVQFANQPSRLAALDSDTPEIQVDRVSGASTQPLETSEIYRGPQATLMPAPAVIAQPLNLMVNRRPFGGLFPFRRPQYQVVTAGKRQAPESASHRTLFQEKLSKN